MTKKKVLTANEAWELRKSYNRSNGEVNQPKVVISTTNPKDTSEPPVPLANGDTPEPQNPVNQTVEKDLVESLTKARNDNLRYIEELKGQIAKLKEDTEAKEAMKLPKTEAEIETFAKQHPDLYNIMISVVKRDVIKTSHELKKEIKAVEQDTKKLESQKAFNEVLKVHADAAEITASEKFKEWARSQTSGIKALLDSDSVKDAVLVLTLYKEDMGISDGKRYSSKEAAKSPSGTSKTQGTGGDKPIFKDSEVFRMSEKQFAKLEKEIDLARKEGRYIYDMSGKRG